MRRLLVTGVPGWLTDAFIHCVANTTPPGLEEVRSLVVPGTRAPDLPDNTKVRFSIIPGTLEDDAALTAAASGCDAVLHAAGLLHVRHTSDWYKVNADGTGRLLKAACAANVRRFVLVSSNAAAGQAPPGKPLTESDPAKPLSHYGRSKLLAENLVLRAPCEGVVIRPCMFYGPPVPTRHVEIYRRILNGRMPLIGHGNYARSLTHISNLVQACTLALTHPRAVGQVYYIADEQVYTTRHVIEAMAGALDTSPRYLRLPAIVAPFSYWGDRLLAAVGIYWQTLHLVGEANWNVGVSIAKARTELGYTPTVAIDEGMREAVRWCKDHKLL